MLNSERAVKTVLNDRQSLIPDAVASGHGEGPPPGTRKLTSMPQCTNPVHT
jgi:hypothetical protein